MRTRIFSVVALAWLVLRPIPGHAQSVELGAGVAASCEPFEYSICHRNWGTTQAVYANWWVFDGGAIELRGARLDGPQTRIIAVGEEISANAMFFRSYELQHERRRLVQASFLYHFRAGRIVQPFLGGGPGVLWWTAESSCPRRLIECERVIPNGAPGRLEHTALALGFTAGVAFDAPNGVIVRSGIRGVSSRTDLARQARIRDLPRGLPEYFVSIGYRFGREAPKRATMRAR